MSSTVGWMVWWPFAGRHGWLVIGRQPCVATALELKGRQRKGLRVEVMAHLGVESEYYSNSLREL
jgi:hypothetical protein